MGLPICVFVFSATFAIFPRFRLVPDHRATRVSCRSLALSAETECDSGAVPEIVLPIVEAVGKLRQEVLGLHGSNREVTGHREINAASRRHPKRGLRSKHNRIRRPHGS